MTQLNKTRVKILNENLTNLEKGEVRIFIKSLQFLNQNISTEKALKKYYDEEKDELLKMCMDTIRLIKYIINDNRNENVKGELIGFVHAMRSIKTKGRPNPIGPTKPYSLPKRSK